MTLQSIRTGLFGALFLAAATATTISAASPALAGDMKMHSKVRVSDAWIPASPPGSAAHAAYMTIMNHGETPRAITSVSSADYGMAHLHLSATQNGVAVMQPVAQVAVPAGGVAAFKPGGLHVMLMGPKRKLAEGDSVVLTLGFADGEKLDVTAAVRARMPGGMEPNHQNLHKHGS